MQRMADQQVATEGPAGIAQPAEDEQRLGSGHNSGRRLALEFRDLRKVYQLYDKPVDRLKELVLRRCFHRDFVALDGINLAIPQGSSIGIVGDNGAGKTTLLELAVGSLTPTSGSIHRQGSVLGLLALGLGFHEEFTGRQNLFFYGDVLGLSRAMILSKLEEIIDFAEIGAFVEQPLKTYSTGMRMRLAFALVASLDPDILVVDEALAVGDIHFQKKCIDRMLDIKGRGRTILFCSHSTYHVSMFCDQVLWLKHGRVEMLGEPAEVIPQYEAYQMRKDNPSSDEAFPLAQTPVHIESLEILNELPLRTGTDMEVKIRTRSSQADLPFHVTLSLKMDNGRGVFVTGTHLKGQPPLAGHQREIRVTYPGLPLMGGVYSLHARVFDDQGLMLYHEKVFSDLMVTKDTAELGICALKHMWEVG